MKMKRNHGSQDEGGRKQKQQSSQPKKRRLLKQQTQSQLSDGAQFIRKGHNLTSKKFKKTFKKGPRSENGFERKRGKKHGVSVTFSDNMDNPISESIESDVKVKPKKSILKKSSASKSKLQKKTRSKQLKGSKKASSGTPSKVVLGAKRKLEKSNTENSTPKEDEVKKPKLCEMKFKDRKRFRQKQHLNENIFNMSMAAKLIWEQVRKENCPEETKKKLLSELMNLIKGHVKQLIFAHDTVRVIECLVALGTKEQRSALFEELKGDFISISKSKYAKFFLIKILSYGTKEQKDFIINSFKGELVSLVKHVEASLVVETAFNDYANAKQRSEMVQEFYGPSFMLFKDESARNLQDILVKRPEQKTAILKHIKEMLLKITEKAVIRHSIVHHVLREFFSHTDAQSRSELIEHIRESVAEILHTKDGSRVAMNCLWHGTSKDRKKITKSFKMHACKIAKEEHGSLALIALFDCLDDTTLVQQAIINKLCENFEELAQDVHGRKVLAYLVCPRDTHFFHPDVVNILKAGDGNEHSKKPSETRKEELKLAASPALLKLAGEHLDMLLKSNPTCMLLLAILQHACGDRRQTLECIASLLNSPFYEKSGTELHPLEQPSLHFVTKKLLQSERNGALQDKVLFSDVLATSVPEGVMKTWVECNRGTFLLLMLLESGVPSVISRVRKDLKGTHNQLSQKSFKGAELLLAELKKSA